MTKRRPSTSFPTCVSQGATGVLQARRAGNLCAPEAQPAVCIAVLGAATSIFKKQTTRSRLRAEEDLEASLSGCVRLDVPAAQRVVHRV
eukprot:696266-Pleurochrysis_carterae.AAC.2